MHREPQTVHSSIVDDVLRTDREHRRVGVRDGLIPLEDLSEKQWNLSKPTLVAPKHSWHRAEMGPTPLPVLSPAGRVRAPPVEKEGRKRSFCTSSSDVHAHLREVVPFLDKLDWSHVVVAGGAVIGAIVGEGFSDIDFFFVDVGSEAECEDALRKAVGAVLEHHDEVRLVHNRNCVTVQFPEGGVTVQFILRGYGHLSEVLHGFDLGSCAVGFTMQSGKPQVYVTELGRFALEYGLNIVDTTRRSTTYEVRLQKYWRRGFGIVLPGLHVEGTSASARGSGMPLPPGWQAGDSVVHIRPFRLHAMARGNRLTVDFFTLEDPKDRSDYIPSLDREEYDENKPVNYAEAALAFHFVLGQERDGYYRVSEHASNVPDALRGKLPLPKHYIHNAFMDHVFKLRRDEDLRLNRIKYLLRDAFEEFLRLYTQHLLEPSKERKDALTRILEAREKAMTEYVKTAEMPKRRWRLDDPGSQLVGSFNPIVTDEREWYGDHDD